MNIREKLLELRIPVPDAARRYRTGKGCLMWWPVETEDGTPAIDMLPVTREQYEAMLCAGLIGAMGQCCDAPYVAPPQLRSPRG